MSLRKLILSLTDYFIFGCFYMAIIAVIMFLYTRSLFDLQVTLNFIPFVFFSTYASYSLHWYLTPHTKTLSQRAEWSIRHKKFLLIGFIFSVAGVIISFIYVAEHYMLITPLAAITFLYSAPKINSKPFTWLRGKYTAKTLSLTLVWLGVTAVLPVAASTAAWDKGVVFFVANRFVLLLGICILFDYRDRAEDRAEGIINIATFMSDRLLSIVIILCSSLGIISSVILIEELGSLNAAILAIPSVLLFFSYQKSIRDVSDLWYYGYLDGLMALSAILYFLFGYIS